MELRAKLDATQTVLHLYLGSVVYRAPGAVTVEGAGLRPVSYDAGRKPYARSILHTFTFIAFLHPSSVADTVPAERVWDLPICFRNWYRQQRWAH